MKMGAHFGVNFESRMDMTPLIDCIFQLILFLVLTSQITIQAEEVDLPFALEGKETGKIKEDFPALIVNVVYDGKAVKAGKGERVGKIIYNGLECTQKKLTELLQKEVAYDAAPQPYGRNRTPEAGPEGVQLSQMTVLVRADKAVRAEYIRSVFMACFETNPKIYRVRLSHTQPQPQ